MYSQIGKLRAFFKRPFLCLTATANKETRQKIINILQLKNVKLEKMSPEKPNVKIHVQKVPHIGESIDKLEELLQKIREKQFCEKNIIYCSSLVGCGEVYINLKQRLSGNCFPVAMFHSKTPEAIKSTVLGDFVGYWRCYRNPRRV